MRRLNTLLRYYFNLDRDKNDEAQIIDSITRNISFRGTNLWTLFFAILIASVGLNIDSPGVIIGAMLISPLMGPVMGIGLGIGIVDFDLVRRGIKSLGIAVLVSICTSALYFRISPLHSPTQELLSQTTPTIWDVIVALAGGMAGIIGATRREKTNVIPGVAIATALMPPLCTVGFSIATGHWAMIPGAGYLFFINSVLICIASVLVIRFMRFARREFQSEQRRRRMTAYIVIVAAVTIAPSIWLAYRIVQKTVFETAASRFLSEEFRFPATQVISRNYVYEPRQPRIEVLLLGTELSDAQIDTLRQKLVRYRLGETQLVVRQGLDARQEIDFSQIRASIIDEIFRTRDSSRREPPSQAATEPDLRGDLQALFPGLRSYTLSRLPVHGLDSLRSQDSVTVFIGAARPALRSGERAQLRRLLKRRLGADSVTILFR